MELKRDTLLQGGRYRIVDSIGRGGFGMTYLAEQVMAKRKVCIKEFFPKDYYKREGNTGSLTLSSEGFGEAMNKFKTKFIKEAQTIAALDHPNIIHIHDVFEENGTAYYVMDYIEGESLSDIVKRDGAMSERDAMAYIKQVAAALEHIHEQQIMHLDVKPGNIMVRTKDSRSILIDFGLSKHYDADSGDATSTTPVGVSHGFAPMEQYKQGGVSKFSPETDIYSLGATLYYLVTGTVPPDAADVADDGLPTIPAHLSAGVRTAIERAMSEKRKDRPHSIVEFLALLGGGKMAAASAPQSIKEETVINVPKPTASEETVADIPQLAMIDNTSINSSIQATRSYNVGDYYNENGKQGVVFDVWDGGYHGKIVSLDSTKAKWDSRVKYGFFRNNYGPETQANSMDDGMANTDKIISRPDNQYFDAFTWCRSKGDEWYLPSRSEIVTIYVNKSLINSTLRIFGAKLKNDWYWSSTEYKITANFLAWSVSISNGGVAHYNKDYNAHVRAVATF